MVTGVAWPLIQPCRPAGLEPQNRDLLASVSGIAGVFSNRP